MKEESGISIATSGKNEQVKNTFRALFAAMTGLVMARVLDP